MASRSAPGGPTRSPSDRALGHAVKGPLAGKRLRAIPHVLQPHDIALRCAVTALVDLTRLLEGLERAGTSVMALARGGRSQEPWTLYPDEYGNFDPDGRVS